MDAFDWHEAGLTVGQVAERSGAAPSALRFYERQGLISADRTASNQRRYHGDVLCRVAMIRVCQQAGLSLAQIRTALAEAVPDGRIPGPQEWESWHSTSGKRSAFASANWTGCSARSPGKTTTPPSHRPPHLSQAPTRTHGTSQIHPICTTAGLPNFQRAATPNGGSSRARHRSADHALRSASCLNDHLMAARLTSSGRRLSKRTACCPQTGVQPTATLTRLARGLMLLLGELHARRRRACPREHGRH